jgi:hypothetical protein
MQCKELEVVLEQEGWSPLPQAARAHVSQCNSCKDLIADLSTIVAVAHELPAEVDPPARVWISLRAQLEAEGLIKDASGRSLALRGSSWWHDFSDMWRARALACAAVGLLIVTAVLLQLQRPDAHPITQARNLYADTSAALDNDERLLPNMRMAGSSSVDASLRQNLQIVDQFIAECEQRVKEEPRDELAHTYLTGAYEQKAELLSAMMEREGSGN